MQEHERAGGGEGEMEMALVEDVNTGRRLDRIPLVTRWRVLTLP
jgi:hypothetical protein